MGPMDSKPSITCAHKLKYLHALTCTCVSLPRRYADSCPAMNVFLAGALLTLGFNFLLIALMVLALEGHADIYSSKGLYSAVGSQLPQQQPPQQQQQQQRLQLQEDLKGGRGRQMGIAAAAHLVAALLMLLNFAHNGCLATVPLLLMLGLGSAWYAAKCPGSAQCWLGGSA
eukprot:scaffold304595_cov15-Tisochrysis_lutea.AAC.1